MLIYTPVYVPSLEYIDFLQCLHLANAIYQVFFTQPFLYNAQEVFNAFANSFYLSDNPEFQYLAQFLYENKDFILFLVGMLIVKSLLC